MIMNGPCGLNVFGSVNPCRAVERGPFERHALCFRILCLGCGEQTSRSELQKRFEALNPTWRAEAHGMAPDGDVFLTEEQVHNFHVPACSRCGGILKPDVTFFGDTVSREKVDFVHTRLAESDSMLVAGSSLQVLLVSPVCIPIFQGYCLCNGP